MSEELAQDEEDAEDYDMAALERRMGPGHPDDHDDDDATLVGRRGPGSIAEDNVVFEIGDEEGHSDDEEDNKKWHGSGRESAAEVQDEPEREGLINGRAR